MTPEQSAAVVRLREDAGSSVAGVAFVSRTDLGTLLAALDEAQADAARFQWLLTTDGDWAICEWDSNEVEGIGYYRDARDPATVRAAIDAARAGEKP